VMKLGEIDRAIAAADEWRAAEAAIASARRELVAEIRQRGGSWESIGWLLGVTGEAVRVRYGEAVS
jgi:hypothetical protein